MCKELVHQTRRGRGSGKGGRKKGKLSINQRRRRGYERRLFYYAWDDTLQAPSFGQSKNKLCNQNIANKLEARRIRHDFVVDAYPVLFKPKDVTKYRRSRRTLQHANQGMKKTRQAWLQWQQEKPRKRRVSKKQKARELRAKRTHERMQEHRAKKAKKRAQKLQAQRAREKAQRAQEKARIREHRIKRTKERAHAAFLASLAVGDTVEFTLETPRWLKGTVTAVAPLLVQVEGWPMSSSPDQVRPAENTLSRTL